MSGKHRWHDDTEDDNAETAVSPLIFGVDLHPSFQAGIAIEALPASGIAFMAVKVCEGTDSSYMSAGSADWIRRGKAAGLLCLGYHYLHAGNEDAQAQVFAAALRATGTPGMLDAEQLTSSGAANLTIAGIAGFLSRVRAYGGYVPLLYLPFWFWQRMGSPSLTGLPTLWASSYPSSAAGTPQQLYAAVTADRWAGYGGQNVAVLQFAETGRVAGYPSAVDLDAYLGTRDQLAALLGQPVPVPLSARGKERPMREIHLTNPAEASKPVDLSAVLTVDGVGTSLVMPAGARAWFQWSASSIRDQAASANVWWLVERHGDGSSRAHNPFRVTHAEFGAFELNQGTVAIEVGVEQVPPGFVFSAHLDGIGHG